jgi:hypothetical protein
MRGERRPRILEHPLQAVIARALTLEIALPGHLSRYGVCWFAVDHANFAGIAPGARVGRGIIAGLPDLTFWYRGRAFIIELKAKDGTLSEAQMQFLPIARCAGVPVAICCTPEDVLRALDEWEVPRERRTIFQLAG